MEYGFTAIVRKTRDDDIDAACGQLAGEVIDRTKRTAQKNNLDRRLRLTCNNKSKNERRQNATTLFQTVQFWFFFLTFVCHKHHSKILQKQEAAKARVELGLGYLAQQ